MQPDAVVTFAGTVPTSVTPGETVNLSVTIDNTGSTILQFLQANNAAGERLNIMKSRALETAGSPHQARPARSRSVKNGVSRQADRA